jgi:hypothetical protein
MDKLLGFTPDANETLPGVITACTNFIPYENGMKGAPSASTPSSTPALAATCQGAVVVTLLDDTRRILAGTQTKLYQLIAGAWSDLSGAVYTGGADTRWSWAQFGNSTLASNLSDTIQRSTSSGGAFASIATAPKAKIIFSVGAFVMALNTNDATYGSSPNRWWCCASFDETSWTPSVTTLATTGLLVSSPGQITAGGKLGDYAVAYKDKSIHIGQFVGAPAVWDWQQIPGGDFGCVGQDAWCDIGGAHFVVGQSDIFLFDGSRPNTIAVGQVRQWFYDNSNPGYRYKTQCVYDRQNNRVFVWYCSTNSTTLDKALVYHTLTKQWGSITQSVETIMNYVSAGTTIDGLSSISSTIDGLSGYSFDSQYWLDGGRALSVVDTSHQIQLMTGVSTSSSFTTGDAGDDDTTSLLTKIRLRFAPGYAPTTATVNTYTKMAEGDAITSVNNDVAINEGSRFDVLQSGRFHRATFNFTGDVRVLGVGAVLIPQGTA